MNGDLEIVVVVDPDETVRLDASKAIRGRGYDVQTFDSAEALLREIEHLRKDAAICIVSEINLPGAGGLQLQRELSESPRMASFIFYVQQASVQDVVTAMKNGAESVIDKREGIESVLRHVKFALNHARRAYQAAMAQRKAIEQLNSLNPGEHQVLQGILNGQLNKEIAQHLKLSVRTIEQRRRQVFRKLNVQHPASLAQRVLQACQAVTLSIPEDVSSLSSSFSSAPPPMHKAPKAPRAETVSR